MQTIESSITKNVIPVLLDEDGPNKPQMEMTFISDGVKYRYGLSIFRENKRRMVVLHTKIKKPFSLKEMVFLLIK
ncbi:hypothetical protein EIN43_27020 (plasmid) [Enterobacter hormaechei]|uniref:Uncharacterized protein n=1 Tax=Enterobacter hormaechei TaxID=158836 RepID=A0A4Y5ZQH5_9ENTR|nr:hypothetical protein EIN43_27020 [Enterobacter hormaechei]